MQYIITITTGNDGNGGTDARVYLDLFGKNRNIRRIRLDNDNHTRFLPGQSDVFKIDVDELGIIHQLCVYHDNTGKNPSWYLETVTIENEDTIEPALELEAWMTTSWIKNNKNDV